MLALVALIAGLLSPAASAFAAPVAAQQQQIHAGMDCAGHHPAPARHTPGAVDCCVANVCAMNLALPASSFGVAVPGAPETRRYGDRALPQPTGFEAAPLPHPPKTAA